MIDLARYLRARPLSADTRPGTRPLEHSVLGALGIDILEAHSTKVVMRMKAPVGADRSTLLVLAESLASTGAGHAVRSGRRAFGVQLESAHIEDADGSMLVGISQPLLMTENRQVWDVRVLDDQGTTCLVGRCTLAVVAAPDEG